MNTMNDTTTLAGTASDRPSPAHGLRAVAVKGLVAVVVAMAATTLGAALAEAVGVEFEVPTGGETIPLAGIAVVTGVFSVVGVVIALGLRRWSGPPARRFVWSAMALTAISLVPPLLSGAATGTVVALIGLHLVAAAVMVPVLTKSLR